jgi:hypothetical protein
MNSSAIEIREARALAVKAEDDSLTVDLTDGRTIIVPLLWFPRLWHGSSRERSRFEVLADGAYLHWPDLDEDLTVAGLLAGHRSQESPQSLTRWLETRRPESKRLGARRSR